MMKRYAFMELDETKAEDLELTLKRMLDAEMLENKNFDNDSYVWIIGFRVWDTIKSLYMMYRFDLSISENKYMGVDVTVSYAPGDFNVVTFRKKTPNERRPYTMSSAEERYWNADAASTIKAYKAWQRYKHHLRIKKVIFNDPATIVYWPDGTKTVVKAEGEAFDPEKGLAMAIAKKSLGNKGNYYDVFREWLPKEVQK